MMHWPPSDTWGRYTGASKPGGGSEGLQVSLHGVVLSDNRTPRSRAICSSVIGRNEPFSDQIKSRMKIYESRSTHTHGTNYKDLGRPAIAIPASKLPVAGRPGVITRILRRRLNILLYTHTHGWRGKPDSWPEKNETRRHTVL